MTEDVLEEANLTQRRMNRDHQRREERMDREEKEEKKEMDKMKMEEGNHYDPLQPTAMEVEGNEVKEEVPTKCVEWEQTVGFTRVASCRCLRALRRYRSTVS